MKTKERVKEIIAGTLGVPLEEVKDECRLYNDLGGDSIDLVDITLELEKSFDVHYSPGDPVFTSVDITVEELIADVCLKIRKP